MSKQIIEIEKQNAIEAYKLADDNGKKVLSKLFGNKLYVNILERIKTFEDVEEIAGRKLVRRDDETDDEFAYRQVKLIAEVYNEGVVLDVKNTNQNKYYPWHVIDNSSGVGLTDHDCDYWFSNSGVGVRLCFTTSEKAIDAGKKFLEIYSNLKIK